MKTDINNKEMYPQDSEKTLINKEVMEGQDELEALRSEVKMLKERLSRSQIINDRVLRKAMKERSGWLGHLVITELISLPFILLILVGFSYSIGASLWPIVVYFILALTDTFFDWRTFRISSGNILNLPLTELKIALVKQKKERMIQTAISLPAVIIWILWYTLSITNALSVDTKIATVLKSIIPVSFVIGAVIGVIIVIIIYRKAQATNNDLIHSIDTKET